MKDIADQIAVVLMTLCAIHALATHNFSGSCGWISALAVMVRFKAEGK